MRLMRSKNLEIRIAGSSCRPQKWDAKLKFNFLTNRSLTKLPVTITRRGSKKKTVMTNTYLRILNPYV